MEQDDILTLCEGMLKSYFKEIVNYDVKLPLRRIDYWDAMDTYGSDKPDTRYELTLKDVYAIMKKTSFAGFEDAKYIRAIVIPNHATETSRKVLD
jgi:aspartyl-tRNA synthetase